jgi:hypothetical protein
MTGAIGCSSCPRYVAGIHDLKLGAKIKDVDGRVKPGHDA